MKRFARRTLTAVAALFMSISLTVASKCDRLEDYEGGFLKYGVESDLVNGQWTAKLDNQLADLFFHGDGVVEIIFHDKQPLHDISFWEVNMTGDQPALVISGLNGTQHKLRLYPTCEGFVIVDKCGYTSNMVKSEDTESYLYHQTKRQVAGIWTIITPGDHNIGREIQWNFRDDGTFTLAVAPDLYHPSHQGIWDVTPNGNHLILYFTHVDSPESVYATELLEIKSVDFEDLLLDGHNMPRMLAEFEANKTLHFEKDFKL